MVGTQDLFLAGGLVGCTARVLDEGTSAGAAAVTLLAFPGVSMSNDSGATTMAAIGDLSYFVFHHGRQDKLTTPTEPLPFLCIDSTAF